MSLFVLLASLAFAADPGAATAVVAMGDGLVVAPPSARTAAPSTGSWVAALADCLEESAAGRYRVVDRVAPGETARSARERITDVISLSPAVVVLGLGARELGEPKVDPGKLGREVERLVRELRTGEAPAKVVLVGMVAPTLHQADAGGPEDQRRLDDLTGAWSDALRDVAKGEGIRLVDLWSSWPKEDPERARLTTGAWELSDQGHARVAAAVCDVLVGDDRGPAVSAAAGAGAERNP